jgi:hypothetical protein
LLSQIGLHSEVQRLSRQAEEFAGGACVKGWRAQAGVVEQVAVAGDDRFGVAGCGKRDEEVVIGVAHHARRRDRVGKHDREQLEGVEKLVGLGDGDAVAEVGLAESSAQLVEGQRAGDQLERPSACGGQ